MTSITIKRFLLTSLLFSIAACLGSLDDFATNMLYPLSTVNKVVVPESPPSNFQRAIIEKNSNVLQSSTMLWYYRNPNPRAPVIVYYHGNGLNIETLAQANMLKKMLTLNSHLVVFDYPQYGLSKGELTQNGLVSSGSFVFQWAKENFPNSKMIIWGQSLGSAVAIQVTKDHQNEVDRLILTQPWDELRNVILAHYSSLAESISETWYKTHEYNSVKAANQITTPTLIHHGLKDSLVPHSLGQKLSQSFPAGVATFYTIPDRNHNDLLLEQKVWDDIAAFSHQ